MKTIYEYNISSLDSTLTSKLYQQASQIRPEDMILIDDPQPMNNIPRKKWTLQLIFQSVVNSYRQSLNALCSWEIYK